MTATREIRDSYSAKAYELFGESAQALANAAESLAEAMNQADPHDALLVRQHFLDMVESRLVGDVWALASYVR